MRQVNGEEFLEEVERQLTLEQDMERNPEQYKEYIDEITQVEPDYPSHGTFMVVNHRAIPDMGGERPCFVNVDEAVSWAEYNLEHNDYNVYELKVVM